MADIAESNAAPVAPSWFTGALEQSPEIETVDIDGTDIELLTWGRRDLPGLLFVHGMVAHAHWWSFIAPFLAAEYRCAALSLSGMGGSGWRDVYPMDRFAADIDGAITAAGFAHTGRKPVVVAHSFGGVAARRFAERYRDRISGLVLIDSAVRKGAPFKASDKPATCRVFASEAEAVGNFSLRPAQPCANRFLVDFVARMGVRGSGKEWRWAFDPHIRAKMDPGGFDRDIGDVGVPVAFIWGENSALCTHDTRMEVGQRFPSTIRVTIPDCGHHVMLDQPIALVAVLGCILSTFA